ncbi:RICIN domain-containing protein [Actinopolymorpha alba]|uniref:RICIN domain-containing protein n=1 Tax=Actinopolymorpha alba TaxID=533267 RepID=UPI001ED986D1|nr:RICIN domain-containing protein [Actinopolymorpha alba]
MAFATLIGASGQSEARPFDDGSVTARTAERQAEPAKQAQASGPWYTWRLRNGYTRKCLDHSSSRGLRGFDCNFGPNQIWDIYSGGAGTQILKNRATGKCLDHSNSYGLRAITCNGSTYQAWWYRSSESYKNYRTGRCLDHSFSYGFRGYGCNGSSYQRWEAGYVSW